MRSSHILFIVVTCMLLIKFNMDLCAPVQVLAAQDNEDKDSMVITAAEIQEMQALKIADVLNNVSGLKAGDSSVSIHGSYKVKVFVDRRPINDPTSSHSAINWDLVDLNDVQRIEILRGKGGLTYGQDASGGVILITTKERSELSGNIKAYAGNYDTADTSASLRKRAGLVSVGLSGGHKTSNGYKVNNDQEHYQGSVEMQYTWNKERLIGFSVDYLYDERGLSGYPEYPTPHSRKETRNTAYALQADAFGVHSTTHYNDGYRHNTDASKGLDKTLCVGKFGQDVTTSFQPFDLGTLNSGLGISWNQASGTSFADQDEHSASIFASQSLSWPDWRLKLTAGLRGTYYSSFENTLNPEIKVAYSQAPWELSASYSRTDNVPSFYQRYNETSSTKPNPRLVLEKADNLSLTLSTTLGDGLSVSVSGFYNQLTNRITYVRDRHGLGRYQNFGDVLYTGGDVALDWTIHPMLKLKSSYTYLQVTDEETGLRLPCKPRHEAKADLYVQPTDRFSLVLNEEYTSSVYKNKSNTEKIDGYFLTNIRAEYTYGDITLFTKIENLLDTKYYYVDGLLAPPLTWITGIQYVF
ncbi:MAG: TonB-dependent receptor [Desulfovermiculus sp.]